MVSACLLGNKTRYDKTACYNPLAVELSQYFNVIPVCPELDSGMSLPRDPSEIQKDGSVKSVKGQDVTSFYVKGAQMALKAAQKFNIKIAVLKDRSPSCGSSFIHDGLFTGAVIKGQGLTSKLLRQNGIEVISEEQLEAFLKAKRPKED